MARSQYGLPARSDRGDPRGKAAYIRETAKKYGVDPEVALRVAKSEGLSTFQSSVVKKGVREPSWGAFQLYTGGGLGNKFKAETGLDPADPKNEDATIDYALRYASKHGWGSWYGAKNTGIGKFEGIGGGAASAESDKSQPSAATGTAEGYGGVGSDAAASERAARVDTTAPDVPQSGPQTASTAPPADFIDKLQDPKTGAAAGLGEAISGLGQATAGTGMKDMYATPARSMTVPQPVMPAPAAAAPMVDPRQVENQRQQLALAMQRLNSGRLY